MNRAALAGLAALSLALTAVVAVVLLNGRDDDGDASAEPPATRAELRSESRAAGVQANGIAGDDVGAGGASRFATRAPAQTPVEPKLKRPPAAGVLFDVDTGQVLWKRAAGRELPIASLTKMMTALLISEHHRFDERVLVSRRAAETHGSKLGVLPTGKKVPLKPLFYALIMASANDAAVALAEHDAGKVSRFVDRMNLEARRLGLRCSHFSTPNGLKNRRNHSCALDLATLARADLADPRIARVAGTKQISFPFPGKVGTLDLYNNHYFLSRGIAGLPKAQVTGLKTGYTIEAGRCYVTTARLGSRSLGVVLLGSPDPLRQVPALLRAGFGVGGT
jgi:serine-type D-Ala-D-Ala carboxypeptidase (penicillin-binding protein 5/6)